MKLWDLFENKDIVLDLIKSARSHFGKKRLYGGNCGQFALALAQHLQSLDMKFKIAVICYDAWTEQDNVDPQEIILADVPVYHVALRAPGGFYDADGLVSESHVRTWIQQEYGDHAPAMFLFDLNEPYLDTLIRTETAWHIPQETFWDFFQTQLSEAAYSGGLRKWFGQKWVDISRKVDGKHPECGASAGKAGRQKDTQRAYPKCVPANKAAKMTAKQKRSSIQRKRKVERKPGAAGKVDWVKTNEMFDLGMISQRPPNINRRAIVANTHNDNVQSPLMEFNVKPNLEPCITWRIIADDTAQIDNFVVPEHLRGQGIGTHFYTSWETSLPAHIQRVVLVAKNPYAARFWKKVGFKANGNLTHDGTLMMSKVL